MLFEATKFGVTCYRAVSKPVSFPAASCAPWATILDYREESGRTSLPQKVDLKDHVKWFAVPCFCFPPEKLNFQPALESFVQYTF